MQTESGFQFHLVYSGGELTVVAAGEIDLQAAAPLRDVIVAALATRPRELYIDVDEVTFIDAAGARALVQAQRAARAAGVAVTVRGAGSLQQQVLDLVETPGMAPPRPNFDGHRHGSASRSIRLLTPDMGDHSGSDGSRRS